MMILHLLSYCTDRQSEKNTCIHWVEKERIHAYVPDITHGKCGLFSSRKQPTLVIGDHMTLIPTGIGILRLGMRRTRWSGPGTRGTIETLQRTTHIKVPDGSFRGGRVRSGGMEDR